MVMDRIEVITSVERRRRWSEAEKARLVAAMNEPGAVVTEIARSAGVVASLLYRWRRQSAPAKPASGAHCGPPPNLQAAPEPWETAKRTIHLPSPRLAYSRYLGNPSVIAGTLVWVFREVFHGSYSVIYWFD